MQNQNHTEQKPVETIPMKKSFRNTIIATVVIIIVLLVIVIGFLLNPKDNNMNVITNNTSNTNNTNTNTQTNSNKPYWEYTNDKWVANGTPENCKDPVLTAPSDSDLATGILYSGQFRGPYKAHGGINFNGGTVVDNKVDVKLAITGKLIKASRYIQTGEVQYLLDFMSPCGIIVRYDHLLVLAPKFQTIIETLPEPVLNDSRTQDINNGVVYEAGELIATEIGFKLTSPQAFVYDFGVYDLRKPNDASKNATYAEAHKNSAATDFYGVCWLDYLPLKDETILRTLPVVSGESGTTSDYCK